MKKTEFQDESKTFLTSDRIRRFPDVYSVSADFSMAGIESLLIGQCFRDWLTDSEKNFLDLLAFDNGLLFLIKQGRFLHPEDVELFPMELIETALSECGEAFFSHHLKATVNAYQGHYQVHTAQITIPGKTRLVLGMLCPENLATAFEQVNQFSNLVINFRRASRNIESIVTAIRHRYDPDDPALIINRSSGRLLCLNPAAVKLFGHEEKNLTDMEYSQFKSRLSKVMAAFKVKMDNLNARENSLTVMTFTDEKNTNTHGETFLTDLLFDSLHDKAAGVVTAASYLKSLPDFEHDPEPSELVDIILREINNLALLTNRFRLIFNFDRMPIERISLFNELEQAVENIKAEDGKEYRVNIDDHVKPFLLQAPPSAYLFLFEAVLKRHHEMTEKTRAGQINIIPQNADEALTLVFETLIDKPGVNSFSREQWSQYARQLAGNLHLTYTDTVTENQITTQITIPHHYSE
ncbi:MAG: hypothetical protein PHU88_00110 [candidate division Zixibacteria bacterium]|nr:hypothetical protein [candidate division Zixibacteria bacterium]MDD5427161.1 hypothetical protein [candidate division Zixibacteria bacterium]